MTSYTKIGGGLGILFVVFTSVGSSFFVTSFVSNSYLLLAVIKIYDQIIIVPRHVLLSTQSP
jgi:hypothetical protein